MNRLIAAIFCLFFATNILAAEPGNIHFYKQKLIHYHDSGQYDSDVSLVIADARNCLEKQIQSNQSKKGDKKFALVLDIDDTSISLYDYERKLEFGFHQEDFNVFIEKAHMPAISSTLKLYNFAKRHGISVFFISGRYESWRDSTIKSLKAAGYKNWDGLFLRPNDYKHKTMSIFKTDARNSVRSKGYEIIGNIGDQESDFVGDNSTICKFKLPNPYYFIAEEEVLLGLG